MTPSLSWSVREEGAVPLVVEFGIADLDLKGESILGVELIGLLELHPAIAYHAYEDLGIEVRCDEDVDATFILLDAAVGMTSGHQVPCVVVFAMGSDDRIRALTVRLL